MAQMLLETQSVNIFSTWQSIMLGRNISLLAPEYVQQARYYIIGRWQICFQSDCIHGS